MNYDLVEKGVKFCLNEFGEMFSLWFKPCPRSFPNILGSCDNGRVVLVDSYEDFLKGYTVIV